MTLPLRAHRAMDARARAVPFVFAVVGVGCAVGCFADRAPPDGIACEVESDCPEAQTCRAALGTCVDVDGLDTAPPAPGDIVITPTTATFTDEVRVSFTTERLLEPPVLTTDTDDLPFALVGNDSDDGSERWTFTAVVPSNASDRGRHELAADLTDESGNGARVTVGTVTLDLDAPEVSSCQFDPPSLSLSEESDRSVVVEMAFFGEVTVLDLELVGRPPANAAYFLDYQVSRTPDGGETHVAASYQKTGAEPPGTYEVVYVVRDPVGNVSNAIGCSMQITP